MLNAIIHDDEWLYRAINTHPSNWKEIEDRPSTAIFKDKKGVSIDRKGNRHQDEVIKTFYDRFEIKAIVKLTALQCRNIEVLVKSDPKPNNIYHAEIHGSDDKPLIPNSKIKKLLNTAIENGIIFPN